MKVTAFVSHHDCSRHDTGWSHPDHQGRLPALTRAVYRDMLTLFEPLLEVEGRHAGTDELELVHTPEYLGQVRAWSDTAKAEGRVIEPVEGIRVSAASWDAASAAVGCALAGVDAVLEKRVRNAFCAVRPPGAGAMPDRPGGYGLFNSPAIAARDLLRRGVAPVVIVQWGSSASPAIRTIFEGDRDVVVLDATTKPTSTAETPEAADLAASMATKNRLDPDPFIAGLTDALDSPFLDKPPAFVLLVASFDGLAGDPTGETVLTPREYFEATAAVRTFADRWCDGRLVSILDAGYGSATLGEATVQHLRGLAGLSPAN